MAKSSMIPWDFKLEEGEKITKILIRHGFVINGIGFEITDKLGKALPVKWYEGTEPDSHDDPHKETTIPLDGDFVTHVSGTYGHHEQELCITTINIHTNLYPEGYEECGIFKEPSKVKHFSSPLPSDGSIFGYLGCTDKFLGSIGTYSRGNNITKSDLYGDNATEPNWYIMLKEDEKISTLTIKNAFVIDGFVFEVKNTKTGKSYTQEFSGPEDNKDPITLADHEVITQIDGKFGTYEDEGTTIAWLKFFTNVRTKGIAYGNLKEITDPQPFSHKVAPKSSIVGFYGSHELFLNSIGIIEKAEEDHTHGPYGRTK